MNCLNCYNEFSGHYCPRCGQKATTKRLTIYSILSDLFTAIADTERGILKTVIDLSQNPGDMLNKYLEGKRQRYFSTAKYTLLLVVIFTVNISALENHYGFFENITNLMDQLSAEKKGDDITLSGKITLPSKPSQKKGNFPPKQESKSPEVHDLNFTLFGKKVEKKFTDQELIDFIKRLLPLYHHTLFDFLKILIVLWIPISSIFSYLIFYRSPLNFAEHLTINSYIYAQMLLIFTVLSPAYWLLPNMAGTTYATSMVCVQLYLVWAYMQVFRHRSFRLIKTVTSLSFSMITYCIVLAGGLLTLALYIAVENIDLL